ncbi:MAG: 6-phospho-3-hexuloisomerase [Candidatus Methanofastidiosia archaeon]
MSESNHTVKESMREIISHIEKLISRIRDDDIDQMLDAILHAKRIFIVGAGRSGLVGKAFAMRLMNLDLDVHVIGETTTPAFTKEDILVAISGSGETRFPLTASQVAIETGGKVVAVTSRPKSILARLADILVVVKGRTKDEGVPSSYTERDLKSSYRQLAPLGTLFEDSAMIFLDGIIAALMAKLEKKEEDLRKRHASIE